MSQLGTDMMAWGKAWQAGVLKATVGIAAKLCRGATQVAVTVTSQGGGQAEYATMLGDSPESTTYLLVPPEEAYCGFTMLVADYDFGVGPVQPERGDYLLIGSARFVLESPVGSLPWKYADPEYQNLLWLHTKRS